VLIFISSPARLAALLLLSLSSLLAQPASAQKNKGNATAPAFTGPRRLQPLYGNLAPAQAQQAAGAAMLANVASSFASRAEASKFFSQKGFEYLREGQPDTAIVRFNLAYVLDPLNPDPYRGLAVLLSQRPAPTDPTAAAAADETVRGLVLRGLAVAPTNALLLTDAATTAFGRYEATRKKRDLLEADSYAQRALLADPAIAAAWQTQARVRFAQQDYAGSWQAVHKAQALNLSSLDFQFLTELLAKAPDPDGKFK